MPSAAHAAKIQGKVVCRYHENLLSAVARSRKGPGGDLLAGEAAVGFESRRHGR